MRLLLVNVIELDEGDEGDQGCQVSRILREAHAFCFDLPLASALAIVSRKAIVKRISPVFKVWSKSID